MCNVRERNDFWGCEFVGSKRMVQGGGCGAFVGSYFWNFRRSYREGGAKRCEEFDIVFSVLCAFDLLVVKYICLNIYVYVSLRCFSNGFQIGSEVRGVLRDLICCASARCVRIRELNVTFVCMGSI